MIRTVFALEFKDTAHGGVCLIQYAILVSTYHTNRIGTSSLRRDFAQNSSGHDLLPPHRLE